MPSMRPLWMRFFTIQLLNEAMKQVISVKDLEEMLRGGKDLTALPPDALLTPSARDFLHDLEGPGMYKAAAGETRNAAPVKPVTSKSSQAEIEAYFNSPQINELKSQISDIGRRLWHLAYVYGNGVHIEISVTEALDL